MNNLDNQHIDTLKIAYFSSHDLKNPNEYGHSFLGVVSVKTDSRGYEKIDDIVVTIGLSGNNMGQVGTKDHNLVNRDNRYLYAQTFETTPEKLNKFFKQINTARRQNIIHDKNHNRILKTKYPAYIEASLENVNLIKLSRNRFTIDSNSKKIKFLDENLQNEWSHKRDKTALLVIDDEINYLSKNSQSKNTMKAYVTNFRGECEEIDLPLSLSQDNNKGPSKDLIGVQDIKALERNKMH